MFPFFYMIGKTSKRVARWKTIAAALGDPHHELRMRCRLFEKGVARNFDTLSTVRPIFYLHCIRKLIYVMVLVTQNQYLFSKTYFYTCEIYFRVFKPNGPIMYNKENHLKTGWFVLFAEYDSICQIMFMLLKCMKIIILNKKNDLL